jgi:hypothetical protein
MKITENPDGTFRLEAENQTDNHAIIAIQELLFNPQPIYDDEIVNEHGFVETLGGERNWMTVPAPEWINEPETLNKSAKIALAGH